MKAENDAHSTPRPRRAPDSCRAAAGECAAARHRANISRFSTQRDMHVCPRTDVVLADERFTRYYDDIEPGLAQFAHDIIVQSIAG